MTLAVRIFILFLIWLAVVTVSPLTLAEPQQPPVKEPTAPAYLSYKKLVERAKDGDLTVDFVEMIAAASDWDLAETAIFTAPNRDAMVMAFKEKRYKEAVVLAEAVLEYEFTNRGLHRATANAYRELGNGERAQFHEDIGEKILKALLSTGDGLTPETAYCVQGINEEYVIMAHFGYDVSSQAYNMSSVSAYDVLTGKDTKTGKKVSLYFDISGLFVAVSKVIKKRRTNHAGKQTGNHFWRRQQALDRVGDGAGAAHGRREAGICLSGRTAQRQCREPDEG